MYTIRSWLKWSTQHQTLSLPLLVEFFTIFKTHKRKREQKSVIRWCDEGKRHAWSCHESLEWNEDRVPLECAWEENGRKFNILSEQIYWPICRVSWTNNECLSKCKWSALLCSSRINSFVLCRNVDIFVSFKIISTNYNDGVLFITCSSQAKKWYSTLTWGREKLSGFSCCIEAGKILNIFSSIQLYTNNIPTSFFITPRRECSACLKLHIIFCGQRQQFRKNENWNRSWIEQKWSQLMLDFFHLKCKEKKMSLAIGSCSMNFCRKNRINAIMLCSQKYWAFLFRFLFLSFFSISCWLADYVKYLLLFSSSRNSE